MRLNRALPWLIGAGVLLWFVNRQVTSGRWGVPGSSTSLPLPGLPQLVPRNASPIGFNEPGFYSGTLSTQADEWTVG